MLVYGDHQFQARLQTLRGRLAALVADALANPSDLDRLRTLLILCGQVEQGVHDTLAHACPPDAAAPLVAHFHQATAFAAEAFYNLAWQQPIGLPAPVVAANSALHKLQHTLKQLDQAPDLLLTVNVPEGFSLYALYPEQYLVATARWLAQHASQRTQGAVVVGIRSIGTTLAAVVSTVLRAAGWQVHSFTVRPAGHPYSRQVELAGVQINPAALGLIVDEGPGISGSSMAATADALVAAGLPREQLAFLPGHANDPGGAGSPAVQAWWQAAPRYVADANALTFNGLPLQDALAATLPEPVIQIEDLSSGQWRRCGYPNADAWPASCTAFERIKYRYTLPSGRKVLFKFLGLASASPALTSTAQEAARLLAGRAAAGLGARVLGAAYGFVATEWIEGVPLDLARFTPDQADRAVDQLGGYIAQVAGPALSEGQARQAIERLTQMLDVNTREALGDRAAKQIQRYVVAAAACPSTYGDGHMQPHEWISTDDGRLCKVDSIGHDADHTLIGPQPVAWDLAGAIVEWRLDQPSAARLLRAYRAAGGTAIDAERLAFYRAAYLAFRLGQCTLAAQVHDPNERDRLLAAAAIYRQQLAALVG